LFIGLARLATSTEEDLTEESEPTSEVSAEEILHGEVLDTVMDHVHISARDQMSAALFRSTEAADALARDYYINDSSLETRQHALMIIAEVARRGWPEDYRGTFLATLLPDVLDASRNHRVPPSVALGQAILESGWGRSGLSTQHYNLFGVKAGSSKQRVEVPTREHSGTAMFMTRATFRTYESIRESISHHSLVLGTDRRYAHARPYWTDWKAFLEAIAPRYASAPTYAARVSHLIQRYHLDAWDAMIVEAVEHDE
jgi:flagellum-specific peptidoglycan hydrolase FlgJ